MGVILLLNVVNAIYGLDGRWERAALWIFVILAIGRARQASCWWLFCLGRWDYQREALSSRRGWRFETHFFRWRERES